MDSAEAAEGTGAVVKRAVTTGLYFLSAVLIVAAIREILGSASIAGIPLTFLTEYKISAMGKAPGAYIALAITAALFSRMGGAKEKEEK